MRCSLAISLVFVLAVNLFIVVSPGRGAATREQIGSRWTDTPPIIDGVFASREWSNPQITMKTPDFPLESYVYFENDASNLYYVVDVVGDNTDSKVRRGSATFFDESLLVFNFVNQVGIRFHGVTGAKNPTNSFKATIGFDSSPNSPQVHRIFEFSVPLKLIRAKPGQNLSFCSPAGFGGVGKLSIAYDADTGKDNIWPLGLSVTFEDTWGILFLDKAPMDTTIVTSSTTTEIPEFPTAMIGMVTALGLSLYILRRSMRKSH